MCPGYGGSGHRYFYAQFSVVAQSDIGSMGIFGEKYCELTFAQMNKRVCCIAVKLHIGFVAVRYLRMLQRRNGCPADYLCAFEGYMYVDETTVGFQSSIFTRYKGRFFALDDYIAFCGSSGSIYSFNKLIGLMVLKPFDCKCDSLLDCFEFLCVFYLTDYHGYGLNKSF